jgi:hypothetical protein
VVLTFTSEMTRIVTDKAISLILLLKISCLFSLCGVLLLVLLLVVVGFIRVVLLYHICTRGTIVGGGNGVAVGRELRCALLEEVSYGRSWQWCTGRAEMEEDSEKDFVILGTSLLD